MKNSLIKQYPIWSLCGVRGLRCDSKSNKHLVFFQFSFSAIYSVFKRQIQNLSLLLFEGRLFCKYNIISQKRFEKLLVFELIKVVFLMSLWSQS